MAAFGDFEERLANENTALIVSVDHGESFEGGIWGHAVPTQLRPMIHIPLAVRLPGQTASWRIETAVDQTAVAPTIMEIAGLKPPEWMDGQSLMPWMKGDTGAEHEGVAFTQYFVTNSAFAPVTRGTVGAIDGRHQYVIDLETGKGSLFRLAEANVQNNDIGAKEPELAASMREMILSRFPELPRGAV
jgi:arylsulfatase A-like enzyme